MQKHNPRSSSHGRRLHTAQPSKLKPLMKRGHSYNHSPVSGQAPTIDKPDRDGIKRISTGGPVQTNAESEEDMESFLQFCPACEKQIATPGASTLYCSEACRRRDSLNQTPMQALHSPTMRPSISYFDAHAANIVPQRSPTVLRPLSLDFSELSIEDAALTAQDKPHRLRTGSQTSHYLDQYRFDSRDASEKMLDNRLASDHSCNLIDGSGLPSLVHSPSSSLASTTSMAAPRLLSSRHNKSYSAYSTPSVDLVSPHRHTASSDAANTAAVASSAITVTPLWPDDRTDQSSEKRKSSGAQSSLKALSIH
ncbi:hypothetical protein LTR17_001742 [Elasticomyces elasticus]|nr:hypothetical protein LTR17_001742 [Elasticomyces elasticus]